MRKFIFIISCLFFTQSQIAVEIKYAAGISLWGYDKNYNMVIEPELTMDFALDKSRLFMDLSIPVFIGFVYNTDSKGNRQFKGFAPYFSGFTFSDYNNSTWPKILSPAIYLMTYVKELSWKGDAFQLALNGKTPDLGSHLQNTIWYNPFFDVNTDIVNRYLFFKGYNAEFVSSSLTDPSLFFADYTFLPFEMSSSEFLKGFQLVPAIWADLRNIKSISEGAALDLKTGSLTGNDLQVKILADGHLFRSSYILNENISHRIDAGASIQSKSIGLELAYIHKSTYHPDGPFLSSLYGGRSEAYYSSMNKNQGILVKLMPGVNQLINFSVDTEIYPEKIFTLSLKGQMRLNFDRGSLNIAYIHENIAGIRDFLNNQTNNTFAEFDLKYYIIPNTFLVEWRHVLSFNNGSSVKTLVSLMAYF